VNLDREVVNIPDHLGAEHLDHDLSEVNDGSSALVFGAGPTEIELWFALRSLRAYRN
jgi:hypothetical protein